MTEFNINPNILNQSSNEEVNENNGNKFKMKSSMKKNNVNEEVNEENKKSQSSQEYFNSLMDAKYKQEKLYNQKKKKIISNKQLTLEDKRKKIKDLAKKTLKRNSLYDKSGFNVISKSLKRGMKENRIGQRDNITNEINETKNNILTLKYKLLYGFLNEDDIQEDFDVQINKYKKLLKKRQNIDFLKEKQNKEELSDVKDLKDRLKSLIQEYNTLLIKDKVEANKLYIEEIVDIKNKIFNLENKWLEVITDDNDKHYLYLPEKYSKL